MKLLFIIITFLFNMACAQEYDESNTEYKFGIIKVKEKKIAIDIIKQLSKGANFSILAKEKSISSTAKNGGLLEWKLLSDMLPEFSDEARKLSKHGYSKTPILVLDEWYIVMLYDIRLKTTESKDSSNYEPTDTFGFASLSEAKNCALSLLNLNNEESLLKSKKEEIEICVASANKLGDKLDDMIATIDSQRFQIGMKRLNLTGMKYTATKSDYNNARNNLNYEVDQFNRIHKKAKKQENLFNEKNDKCDSLKNSYNSATEELTKYINTYNLNCSNLQISKGTYDELCLENTYKDYCEQFDLEK